MDMLPTVMALSLSELEHSGVLVFRQPACSISQRPSIPVFRCSGAHHGNQPFQTRLVACTEEAVGRTSGGWQEEEGFV